MSTVWVVEDEAHLAEGLQFNLEAEGHDVEVLDVPAMSVVSLGWRGRPSRGEVTAAHADLRAWIAARKDLEVAGAPRLLSYNGPSTPTSRACSEVQIPVRVVTEDERAAD